MTPSEKSGAKVLLFANMDKNNGTKKDRKWLIMKRNEKE